MTARAERPDHAREIRNALVDPVDVCDKLGLLGRGRFKRQAGGVIVCCPWHEERTPSCSIRRSGDGTIAAKCHGCQASGDVLSLIAQVYGLNTRSDFPQVLRAGAELAGMLSVVEELARGQALPNRPPPPPPPPPEPERTYPTPSDLASVWGSSIAVSEDAQASAWLATRGLDAELVAADDLARAIPSTARLPRWARYQGASWIETGHRLVVPMFDACGVMRSVRASRVADGESPKRLPPGGHKATELVMANPIGLAMLRGEIRPARLVVTEGEPDWLVWCTRRSTGPLMAVVGIVTGSWTAALAERVPVATEVIIRTDHDAAGDTYANTVFQSLKTKCFVRRGGKVQ